MVGIKKNPGGRRSTERLRKTWLKEFIENLKEMGTRTWRRSAQDRKNGQKLFADLVLQGP